LLGRARVGQPCCRCAFAGVCSTPALPPPWPRAAAVTLHAVWCSQKFSKLPSCRKNGSEKRTRDQLSWQSVVGAARVAHAGQPLRGDGDGGRCAWHTHRAAPSTGVDAERRRVGHIIASNRPSCLPCHRHRPRPTRAPTRGPATFCRPRAEPVTPLAARQGVLDPWGRPFQRPKNASGYASKVTRD